MAEEEELGSLPQSCGGDCRMTQRKGLLTCWAAATAARVQKDRSLMVGVLRADLAKMQLLCPCLRRMLMISTPVPTVHMVKAAQVVEREVYAG